MEQEKPRHKKKSPAASTQTTAPTSAASRSSIETGIPAAPSARDNAAMSGWVNAAMSGWVNEGASTSSAHRTSSSSVMRSIGNDYRYMADAQLASSEPVKRYGEVGARAEENIAHLQRGQEEINRQLVADAAEMIKEGKRIVKEIDKEHKQEQKAAGAEAYSRLKDYALAQGHTTPRTHKPLDAQAAQHLADHFEANEQRARESSAEKAVADAVRNAQKDAEIAAKYAERERRNAAWEAAHQERRAELNQESERSCAAAREKQKERQAAAMQTELAQASRRQEQLSRERHVRENAPIPHLLVQTGEHLTRARHRSGEYESAKRDTVGTLLQRLTGPGEHTAKDYAGEGLSQECLGLHADFSAMKERLGTPETNPMGSAEDLRYRNRIGDRNPGLHADALTTKFEKAESALDPLLCRAREMETDPLLKLTDREQEAYEEEIAAELVAEGVASPTPEQIVMRQLERKLVELAGTPQESTVRDRLESIRHPIWHAPAYFPVPVGVSPADLPEQQRHLVHRSNVQVEVHDGERWVRVYQVVYAPAKPGSGHKDVRQSSAENRIELVNQQGTAWINAGQPWRALHYMRTYRAQALASGKPLSTENGRPLIRSWLVPEQTYGDITSTAIGEGQAGVLGERSLNVDVNAAADQYGVRGEDIAALERHSRPGSLVTYAIAPDASASGSGAESGTGTGSGTGSGSGSENASVRPLDDLLSDIGLPPARHFPEFSVASGPGPTLSLVLPLSGDNRMQNDAAQQAHRAWLTHLLDHWSTETAQRHSLGDPTYEQVQRAATYTSMPGYIRQGYEEMQHEALHSANPSRTAKELERREKQSRKKQQKGKPSPEEIERLRKEKGRGGGKPGGRLL